MMRKYLLLLCLLVVTVLPIGQVHAQENPEAPTYIVQPGDTLAIIATRFGVSVNDIISENGIVDANTISVNAELRIPGLEGIQGRLTTSVVPLGSTYQKILKARQLPEKQFIKLNRITSPAEIVAGVSLLMPELEEEEIFSPYIVVGENQTAIELAVTLDQNPWSLLSDNQQDGSWDMLPAEQIFAPEIPDKEPLHPVSGYITGLEIAPLPLKQGQTTTVKIQTDQPISITGSLAGHTLNFYESTEGEYVAVQGIYGREEPGLAEFQVNIQSADVVNDGYTQFMLVEAINFGELANIYIDPILIDPIVTEPEEDYLLSIVNQITPVQYWDGIFSAPSDEPCINAPYGTSRSYNNGAYYNFHTGVDFGVCAQNLNIYAPASGTIVFAGPWNVRGNATIIDHGQGVFSGIYHQSEILVSAGDQIPQGTLIGQIGNTGRSTGPHLHWDLWVGGVQVDPLKWLNYSFP
jgi:murein DD-endopeptidase MepM/ murein hydrolase activator NlpD